MADVDFNDNKSVHKWLFPSLEDALQTTESVDSQKSEEIINSPLPLAPASHGELSSQQPRVALHPGERPLASRAARKERIRQITRVNFDDASAYVTEDPAEREARYQSIKKIHGTETVIEI